MTDINEAIARWIGHTGDGPANIPYDLSLDLQVPVWEALRELMGYPEFCMVYAGDTNYVWAEGDIDSREYGATPAEAWANFIHAALVAIGEVEE